MDQLDADRERFLALIRHWHADHDRTDQVEHCIQVMRWLDRALDQEDQESPPQPARRAMILAALGHDLYEDSEIDRAFVVAEYGSDVDQLIKEVSERNDIPDPVERVAEFVERVATGPEEARLIKLCDGIDNYGGLVQNGLVRKDPAKWVEVVRQQMEPMFSRLAGVPFQQYKAAGEWLGEQLKVQRERFWAEVG